MVEAFRMEIVRGAAGPGWSAVSHASGERCRRERWRS